MNEKVKKALSWLGGIFAFVIALLCGKWKHNADRKRISDAKDSVENGRRTTGEIRERNQTITDETLGIADSSRKLADEIRESSVTTEQAGRSVEDARNAVRFGLELLDEAEKRNKDK